MSSEWPWIRERPASWDAGKQRVIGDAPKGIFDRRYGEAADGERLPGDWWRVERAGQTLGYGWMDIVWGDAEILMAVAEDARDTGLGSFILEHLANEARSRGVNYVYNVVRPTHPEAPRLRAWLTKRGFKASDDGSLIRNVSSTT